MSADHDSQPGCAGLADRALLTIAAERHADGIVRGVQAGELDAEGLALELGRAYGIVGLQALALARAIVKALGPTG